MGGTEEGEQEDRFGNGREGWPEVRTGREANTGEISFFS